MSDPVFAPQAACGCCDGVGSQAPLQIHNRPGLSAIAYRIGNHAEILATLLARLSSKDHPALAQLRSRDRDDFSIALLDAFAGMADVLTFYQERIANESYLRTAGERLSLQQLARLIGYRLIPGVAAETWLAFTAEAAVGAPAQVRLEAGIKVQSVPGQDEKPQTFETVEEIEARPGWNLLKPRMREMIVPSFGTRVIHLRGTSNQLKAGDALLLVGSERANDTASERWEFRGIQQVHIDSAAETTVVTLDRGLGSESPRIEPPANPEVYALRLRASLFGYNAPDWRVMSDEIKRGYLGLGPGDEITDTQWPGFTIAEVAGVADTVHLERSYPQIVPDSWLVLSQPAYQELYQVASSGEDSRTAFMLTGKTTKVSLEGENLEKYFNNKLRETAVFAQSELLALAETPITDEVAGDSLSVDQMTDLLEPGRRLLLTGLTTAGEPASEILTLLHSENQGTGCTLTFSQAMEHQYQRDTVSLYANVARATHGETVHQILGSGEARKAHQRFTLKHAPLTFVSADNESGATAALEVRVKDIAWHEAPTLYDSKAGDRSYVVRIDEDGAGQIQFGDGLHGARLPSGRENIHAIYRKGLGSAGNLKAGQLSQLLTRPLGLKEVSNPQAASGGVDAEAAADARRNMPLGVRTLGRAVSLRDYEDYARAYTGIARATASVLPVRGIRTIFITVAGSNGDIPAANTLASLLTSLRKNSDPLVACATAAFVPAYFRLALRIKHHPDHDRDIVQAAVEAQLRLAFSFEQRDFGLRVARSEVIRVAQQVSGVIGVDVDYFYRGATPTLENRLTPAPATLDLAGDGIAAEMLLLDPGPLDYLQEMP